MYTMYIDNPRYTLLINITVIGFIKYENKWEAKIVNTPQRS